MKYIQLTKTNDMKKLHFLTACWCLVALLPLLTIAQKVEWVEQVIVGNGNKFEATPPYIDYVTVQTYDPSNGSTSVFDVIKTQSVQDVLIANQKIYVAAQDSIIMYDANTLLRLAAVADSGLSACTYSTTGWWFPSSSLSYGSSWRFWMQTIWH